MTLTTGSVMRVPSLGHGRYQKLNFRESSLDVVSDSSFGNSHFLRLQYPHIEPHQNDQDWRIDVEDLQRRLSTVNSTEWKVGFRVRSRLNVVHHLTHIPVSIPYDNPSDR